MRAPIDNFILQDWPRGSVTQWFGENPALYSLHVGMKGHNGIDIVAYKGCPLVAVEDGDIIDVRISYPMDLETQMLEWSGGSKF